MEAPPLAAARLAGASHEAHAVGLGHRRRPGFDGLDGAYSVRSATRFREGSSGCGINVKQLTPLIVAGVLCAAAAISVQPIVAHVVEERAREAIV